MNSATDFLTSMPDKAADVHITKRRGPALRLNGTTIRRIRIDGDDAAIVSGRAVVRSEPHSRQGHASVFITAKTVAVEICVATVLHQAEEHLHQVSFVGEVVIRLLAKDLSQAAQLILRMIVNPAQQPTSHLDSL